MNLESLNLTEMSSDELLIVDGGGLTWFDKMIIKGIAYTVVAAESFAEGFSDAGKDLGRVHN